MDRRRLISLRMNVLGHRSGALVGLASCCLPVLEQLKTRLDVYVGGIQIGCTLVGIQRIGRLVVARFVQCSKVVPNLTDVWIESNGARVRIERVTVLIDLVVKHTDRAPECRVPAVPVHSLLIGFVCLRILLL